MCFHSSTCLKNVDFYNLYGAHCKGEKHKIPIKIEFTSKVQCPSFCSCIYNIDFSKKTTKKSIHLKKNRAA